MKNKRTNKIVTISIIGIIIIVASLIFILNYSKDDSSFSIMEKKWISDNKDKMLDISIYNDVPLFGKSGEGIAFELLDTFTKEYSIGFNKIPYLAEKGSNSDIAFKVINYNTKINDNDIVMYEDKYVILGKDSRVIKQHELSGMKIGVVEADANAIKYFLNNNKIEYASYKNVDELLNAYAGEDLNNIVLPSNMYLNTILTKDNMFIIYHISEMSNKYVLSINNNDKFLGIMKKYYQTYMEEKYEESFSTQFINTFFNDKNMSEHEKASYNGNVYNYGFVRNMPYEFIDNKEYVGIISNYIKSFAKVAKVEFRYSEYKSIAKLKEEMTNGNIDVAFSNFRTNDLKNIEITSSLSNEEYVIASKKAFPATSLNSLLNRTASAVKGTHIYDALTENNIDVRGYSNIEDLLLDLNDNSIVVIDKETYDYYKTKKFSGFYNIYTGNLAGDYNFILRKGNTSFNKLFTYYVSMVDYNEVKFSYNSAFTLSNPSILSKVVSYIFFGLGIIFVIITIIISVLRKRKKDKLIRKEEKIKFIDMMTSLKNRNYLNHNINKWDENVIYPQGIVVIDLNEIKTINDEYGREEGDSIIKKAASILIVNQQENTDIIRTDGNEFLVYMVGYEEKEVISYSRKIYKELKDLSHGYGASIGYSMITDEIKTIDDAINEATIEMRKAKERMKQS